MASYIDECEIVINLRDVGQPGLSGLLVKRPDPEVCFVLKNKMEYTVLWDGFLLGRGQSWTLGKAQYLFCELQLGYAVIVSDGTMYFSNEARLKAWQSC